MTTKQVMQMNTLPKRLKIIALQDDSSGVITAYIDDMPGLLVQGNSTTDITVKMNKLIDNFIMNLDARRNHLEIETKSL